MTTFTGTIRVYPTPDGWMANFDGTKEVSDLRELFGLRPMQPCTLPTPFTAQADAAVVVKELSRLNPLATVHADA